MKIFNKVLELLLVFFLVQCEMYYIDFSQSIFSNSTERAY